METIHGSLEGTSNVAPHISDGLPSNRLRPRSSAQRKQLGQEFRFPLHTRQSAIFCNCRCPPLAWESATKIILKAASSNKTSASSMSFISMELTVIGSADA